MHRSAHLSRRWRSFVGAATAVAAAAVVVTSTTAAGLTDAAALADEPTATTAAPQAAIGALFTTDDPSSHICTASVLDSAAGDLILTAAHCVSGSGNDLQFRPAYDNGNSPYGAWNVEAAYVMPSWLASQDPHADFAVLRVADQTRNGKLVSLQQVTGGYDLDTTPAAGTPVTDYAYNSGEDQPIGCTTPLLQSQGYPAIACNGYTGGSSGSPFLAKEPDGTQRIVGVIGGYYQGGCEASMSYSSPVTLGLVMQLVRGDLQATGDNVPQAGDSGC